MGGGKPSLIAISLKPEHAKSIGRVMGREDWKCSMQNIQIVHENNELLYALPHGYYSEQYVVTIPRSEILTVVHQTKALDENHKCLE